MSVGVSKIIISPELALHFLQTLRGAGGGSAKRGTSSSSVSSPPLFCSCFLSLEICRVNWSTFLLNNLLSSKSSLSFFSRFFFKCCPLALLNIWGKSPLTIDGKNHLPASVWINKNTAVRPARRPAIVSQF